jgi:hypothetical protein
MAGLNILPLTMRNAGIKLFRRVGFRPDASEETKEDCFRFLFGSSSANCARIWNDLVADENGNDFKKSTIVYFLLTVRWLKVYPTLPSLSAASGLSLDTIRKWVWKISRAIEALKPKKVSYKFVFYCFKLYYCS